MRQAAVNSMKFPHRLLVVAVTTGGILILPTGSAGYALTRHNARSGCPKTFTVPMVKRAMYWTFRGTRDVSHRERRIVDRIVRCERFPRSEHYVRGMYKQVRRAWRERRYEDALTPYGNWAIPSYIVYCESRFQNTGPNSATASGYYQITSGTWASYGGGAYASAAYLASKSAQDLIASLIWADGAGASQWTCA